jgi:hypothetical protein
MSVINVDYFWNITYAWAEVHVGGFFGNVLFRPEMSTTGRPMITIVYGSILRPSSNNWASYRRLKWQIAALFL